MKKLFILFFYISLFYSTLSVGADLNKVYPLESLLSFLDIKDAVSSWGKIQVILGKDQINHAVLIEFNEPINSNALKNEGIWVNLYAGGIWHSPFSLREYSNDTIFGDKFILVDINLGESNIRNEEEEIYNLFRRFAPNNSLVSLFEEETFLALNNKWEKRVKLKKDISCDDMKVIAKFWLRTLGKLYKLHGFYRTDNDKICVQPSIGKIESMYRKVGWELIFKDDNI